VVVNAKVAVTTYHYDNLRTGWNQQETSLTTASFPSKFGILTTVTLDNRVDAQPLLVPGLTIAGGTHDVVYVATESNTVYAIDASTGAILLSRTLGRHGVYGIFSTPVIDLAANTLYVIAYNKGSPPVYQLHALDLGTLHDTVNPPDGVEVAASHTLTNGSGRLAVRPGPAPTRPPSSSLHIRQQLTLMGHSLGSFPPSPDLGQIPGRTRLSFRLSPTERSMSHPLSWMHPAMCADSSISSAPAAPARDGRATARPSRHQRDNFSGQRIDAHLEDAYRQERNGRRFASDDE
jgi:hypothetical protein